MQVCRDVAPTSHCFSERKIPVIQRLYVYSHKDGFEVIALVWRAVFSSFRKNSRRHFRHRETGYLLFFSPLTGWLSWFCRIQKYISGFIFRLNLDFPCCSIIKDSHLASTQNYGVYSWLNCYCSDRIRRMNHFCIVFKFRSLWFIHPSYFCSNCIWYVYN